jgi:hypothetical protein
MTNLEWIRTLPPEELYRMAEEHFKWCNDISDKLCDYFPSCTECFSHWCVLEHKEK